MVPDYLQSLSAEERLLLSLCRLDFSEGQKEEITSLIKKVSDWDRLIHLSNKHGVIALCWYNLNETGNSDKVPDEHLGIIHSGYLKSLTRNTYLFKHLEEIVSLAKTENIKVVLIKGVALEKTVYGNQGLRQMTDIDILVPQNDVIKLRDLLIKNGFISEPLKSPLYRDLVHYYGKHIPSLLKNDCSVDIHFKLFDQKVNTLTEKLIETSIPYNIEECTMFIPSPQIFFLYLIKHLDYHEVTGDSQLRLYADLNVMLGSYYEKIINRNLIDLATEANLKEQLAGKLFLLRSFWDIHYPDWLNDYISQFDCNSQTEKFLDFLKYPENKPVEDQHPDYIKQVRAIPGIFRKILYVTGFIFPSFPFMKNRYQTKTRIGTLLYYPVRWAATGWGLIKAGVKGVTAQRNKD